MFAARTHGVGVGIGQCAIHFADQRAIGGALRFAFEEGEFISPGAALIPCATQQNECTLTIACQVLDLEMRFTGEMTEDASRLVGVATFSGTGACRSAIYDMDAAWRPDLSP